MAASFKKNQQTYFLYDSSSTILIMARLKERSSGKVLEESNFCLLMSQPKCPSLPIIYLDVRFVNISLKINWK